MSLPFIYLSKEFVSKDLMEALGLQKRSVLSKHITEYIENRCTFGSWLLPWQDTASSIAF